MYVSDKKSLISLVHKILLIFLSTYHGICFGGVVYRASLLIKSDYWFENGIEKCLQKLMRTAVWFCFDHVHFFGYWSCLYSLCECYAGFICCCKTFSLLPAYFIAKTFPLCNKAACTVILMRLLFSSLVFALSFCCATLFQRKDCFCCYCSFSCSLLHQAAA